MTKQIKLLILVLISFSTGYSQSPSWRFLRPTNTGVGAEEHNCINEDKFGNIWTTGRSAIQSEGSVVRFNHTDTIFTCWSNFEGHLPSQFIYEAEVDANDVLWVATADGLCKYDGTTWYTFNTANTPLPSDQIRSVTFDNSNNVWITFQETNFNIGGIAKFDGLTWEVYTPANSDLPNHTCFNILIDSQNNKWIHSLLSVTKFDGTTFTDYNNQNSGLYGPQVYDIELDSLDRLYAITDLNGFYMQINIFDGVNWTYMNHTNTPAMSNYLVNRIDIKNDKMILAESGGSFAVLIFDGLNWSTFFGGDIIRDVFIDSNDQFWVSGISTLSTLKNGVWRDYERYSAGLAEHHQYNIFVDSHDRLWAANGNGGINIFDCPRWESYGPFNQGLYPSPQTLSSVGASICEDSFGNIWFAYNSTDGTVVKIPHGDYKDYAAWEIFNLSNSPVSWVEESFADGFGNVFFYSDYGTHMYSNTTGQWTTWVNNNSPLQYYSYGFGVDSSGKAYFGGFQQIAVFNNGVWSLIDLVAIGSGITTEVNGIAFDSQNDMWLATAQGVWKFDGFTWTNWTTSNANLPSNYITSIAINENDSVFVSGFTAAGILTGGFSVFNGTTWTKFNMANSELPGEQIYDIDLDSKGNLYLNTFGQGITVYRKNQVLGFDCIDYSLQVSSPTSVSEVTESLFNQLFSFPNPFTDFTTLEFNSISGDQVAVEIYDVAGKICSSSRFISDKTGTQYLKIDLSNNPSGIYIGKILVGQVSYIVKLIKL